MSDKVVLDTHVSSFISQGLSPALFKLGMRLPLMSIRNSGNKARSSNVEEGRCDWPWADVWHLALIPGFPSSFPLLTVEKAGNEAI